MTNPTTTPEKTPPRPRGAPVRGIEKRAKYLAIRIEPGKHARWKAAAAREGISLTAWLERQGDLAA